MTRLSAMIGMSALCALSAHAEVYTVVLSGSAPATVVTSDTGTPPSTVVLDPSSTNGVTVAGTVTQGVTVVSGYDPQNRNLPFSLTENVTITDSSNNSETQLITIFGQEEVSPTTDPDTFDIFAGPTIYFTSLGLAFTPEAISFFDSPPFPGGTTTATLTGDITAAPEPATSALFASGLFAVGYFARRKRLQKA